MAQRVSFFSNPPVCAHLFSPPPPVFPHQRGNPSGVGLAPSNTVAIDAMDLFQSSYLYRDGLDSLEKATVASRHVNTSSTLASRHVNGSSNSSARTVTGVPGATARETCGTGGGSSTSSSGRRERKCKAYGEALVDTARAAGRGDLGSCSPIMRGRGDVPDEPSEIGDGDSRRGGDRKRGGGGWNHHRGNAAVPPETPEICYGSEGTFNYLVHVF